VPYGYDSNYTLVELNKNVTDNTSNSDFEEMFQGLKNKLGKLELTFLRAGQ